MSPPANVPSRPWEQFIDDSARFAERWAAKAHALGWSIYDAFGCDAHKPCQCPERAGFLWLIEGSEILALSPTSATLRTPSGETKTFHWTTNALPGRVLAWELK